ncbi:unnamed protein product [Leuciscus chuanchicus]
MNFEDLQVDEDYGVDWDGPHAMEDANSISIPDVQLPHRLTAEEIAGLPNRDVPLNDTSSSVTAGKAGVSGLYFRTDALWSHTLSLLFLPTYPVSHHFDPEASCLSWTMVFLKGQHLHFVALLLGQLLGEAVELTSLT